MRFLTKAEQRLAKMKRQFLPIAPPPPPKCDHNWVTDYMGDPDVAGGQMFFGCCTKCGASSDSPGATNGHR